jgi:hypothetical protein
MTDTLSRKGSRHYFGIFEESNCGRLLGLRFSLYGTEGNKVLPEQKC